MALRDSNTVLMNFFSQAETPKAEWNEYRVNLKKKLNTPEGGPNIELPSPSAE